jgi:ferredoxin-thioredoxin reductase catalytic subunit/rhodanese-related sulfurtransferase
MQKEHDKAVLQSEGFQIELKKTRRFAEKVRERMGFLQNPEPSENERIYIGLTNNKIIKGKRYCPCFVVEGNTKEERKKANNRICPCKPALQKEIPKTGKCYCGIFCTAEYIDNYEKIDVDIIEGHSNLTFEKLNPLFEKEVISSIELVDLLNGRNKGLVNFILIDVREIIENNSKMIIGMDRLIPTSNLGNGLDKISDKKDGNIVVYCHSGARSARVQEIMKSIGFKTVINLGGGIVSYGGKTK